MIIMKFGGSALRTSNAIRMVAAIVRNHLHRHPVLVLSAMGNTTDLLMDARNNFSRIEQFHRDLIAELQLPDDLIDPLFFELASAQEQDRLLSFGERFSVRIFSAYLNKVGIAASYFDAWDIGMLATSEKIFPETYKHVPLALKKVAEIPVITGFIAKDREGNVTTLGRNGSDLTASVVGSALAVEEIQLWKDVDGILDADPGLAPKAQSIPQLSFAEAAELARLGAEVLHPKAILPASTIPIRIKNHQNPNHPGTLIADRWCRKNGIVAIAHRSHTVSLIGRVEESQQFLNELLYALANEGIASAISSRPLSLNLRIKDNEVPRCVAALHKRFLARRPS